MREAEQFAAEDKKQREAADIRNQADQMVFQTEKTLEDMGDKIPASDRNSVESALNHLKETQKGSDVEAIKAATEKIQQAGYKLAEVVYSTEGAAAGAQAAAAETAPADDTIEADYEVVDDENEGK